MKLIKINPDHYVIVDDSEIKELALVLICTVAVVTIPVLFILNKIKNSYEKVF